VQDLLWDLRDELVPLILEKRAYIYICGDAKNMAHSVEQKLMAMLGQAKGGSAEVEGAKEFKLLKERHVSFECPFLTEAVVDGSNLFMVAATALGCLVVVSFSYAYSGRIATVSHYRYKYSN
jgi:hypothetical protein